MIWWGQRVPGAPGGGRRLRKFLPVVQVSALEGNTMAGRPAQHLLLAAFPQSGWFLFLYLPCGLGPLTSSSFPLLLPFSPGSRQKSDRREHVPCRPLASGHGTWLPLPLKRCPQASPRGLVIRDARSEVLPGHLRHPGGLLHWCFPVLPGSQRAENSHGGLR